MNDTDTNPHIPVLLEDTVSGLAVKKSGIYLDCTIGFCGHSSRIFEKLNDKGKLIGIDFDPYALEYSRSKLSEYGDNFELHLSNYKNIKSILHKSDIEFIDGILFDLGISSYQVDSGYKGLSYRTDSKLDMNMDGEGYNLKEYLHSSTKEEIADTIYNYGEERGSRKIASSIKKYASSNNMSTNFDLVQAVEDVVPKRFLNKTLSRVFQSMRIKINNELHHIYTSISEAIDLLNDGGRIAVITFHSIEDRLVKNIFKSFSRGDSRFISYIDNQIEHCDKKINLINKKAISPKWEEVKTNKRCRSAKLRIAERASS